MDLYAIESLSKEENKVTASVVLNADHAIFAGHFPDNPILPGVCQMLMVRDLLGKSLERKLVAKTVGNMKFMKPISPVEAKELEFEITYSEIEEGALKTTAKISSKDGVCFKLSGVFV